MKNKLEINDQFRTALDFMEKSNKCLFITGKAGTGKSTLLSHFLENTKKKTVVLAPTGVAALNVKGQTIHSFFNFYIDASVSKVAKGDYKPKPEKLKIIKNLKTIIIDEVSMVRADLMDCIDIYLRTYGSQKDLPFGGVQMIFIGDLYQLPPVINSSERLIFDQVYRTPFFFSANVFKDNEIEILELEKVYRQKDAKFINLLNNIRNNNLENSDMEFLNNRYIPDFKPAEDNFHISLTTVNAKADEINSQYLTSLKGKNYISNAAIKGDFGKEYFPTATDLHYKIGAQIMMLNNDTYRNWVNGSIGVIKAVQKDDEDREYLRIKLQDKEELVNVYLHTWEVFKYKLSGNEIVSEPVGSFAQFPFRLAWAITIHKSQGKTFEKVIIDIGKGTFVAGQVYVALSRCTSFEGVVLKTPIKKQHIRTDNRIYSFLTARHYKKSEQDLPLNDKIAFIKDAIKKKQKLKITYLKANDTKSERVIRPISVGEEFYKDKAFPWVLGFCTSHQEERMFRVDRILSLQINS